MIYIILIVIITLVFFILNYVQNKLTYLPKKFNIETPYVAPIISGGTIVEFNLQTSDNCNINCLYLKMLNAKYTIIYAHGNAGNIYDRQDIIFKQNSFLKNITSKIIGEEAIFSILMFDYRGYGKSSGNPSEKGLYEDILTVYKYLIDEKVNNIILYGESLGVSPILWLGSQNKKNIICLIAQAGFSSIKNISDDHNLNIIKPLISNEYDNIEHIQKIMNMPIYILHSKSDEIIPIRHGYILSKENKSCKFIEIKGGHNCPYL